MEKIVFIILLFLIPFCGISQTKKPIDSFQGIRFGTDTGTFKAAMLVKGGHFIAERSSANFLAFDNVTQCKIKNIMLLVNFVNNKAYEMDLVYPNEPGANTIMYCNELVKDMSEIYGQAQIQKKFTPPYYEGDGKELTAIQSGNAQYFYFWIDKDNNNKIVITIDKSLKVFMVYQDSALLPAN